MEAKSETKDDGVLVNKDDSSAPATPPENSIQVNARLQRSKDRRQSRRMNWKAVKRLYRMRLKTWFFSFARSLGSFLRTSLLIGTGAGMLMLLNKAGAGDSANFACQALSGISSAPLMVASAAAFILMTLVVLAVHVALPPESKLRQLIRSVYTELSEFSVQLPVAVAGVSIATHVPHFFKLQGPSQPLWLYQPAFIPAWMFFFAFTCMATQKFANHLAFREQYTPESRGWKVTLASSLLILAAAGGYWLNFIDWQIYSDGRSICT